MGSTCLSPEMGQVNILNFFQTKADYVCICMPKQSKLCGFSFEKIDTFRLKFLSFPERNVLEC